MTVEMNCTPIDRLKRLTQIDLQNTWRYIKNRDEVECGAIAWEELPLASLDDRGYVSWEAGRVSLWLGQTLIVPDTLKGYAIEGLTLRLVLTWWAEDAQVFVNGALVQRGDLFDATARACLRASAVPGERLTLALRLVSPGHDPGALVRSHLVFESADAKDIDPGFVADELAIARQRVSAATFEDAVAQIDWASVGDRQQFHQSLQRTRQHLQAALPPRSGHLFLLGNTHIDLAWLWRVAETWEVAQRTFDSVLGLMEAFPDLTFCHSTPALYAWLQAHRSDLFARIQKQVARGQWEVFGGLWVEPELNTVCGESIARQLLYGQRYALATFDRHMAIAWLPDSFGFCWQLPQLLQLAGIEYFVTQKLRWNDTTEFPHGLFWWQAPDGTRILSLLSAPIGESIDPLKMAAYENSWRSQTQDSDPLWLFGMGDRGGGPTRDMLHLAQRWQQSPFLPAMQFTTVASYLRHLQNSIDLAALPVWQDELYLEFHRGCYTTHADQKLRNRRCEALLYQAELWSSVACEVAGLPYPRSLLEEAWKQVLFNQFHDILPGSAIPEVYLDADEGWQAAAQTGAEILETALAALGDRIQLLSPPVPDAVPVVVFNALNGRRCDVVAVPLPDAGVSWQVCDGRGRSIPCQMSEEAMLLFLAEVPSVGYQVFWLCPQPQQRWESVYPGKPVLENDFLQVAIAPETGTIASLWDKRHQREVLAGAGNQLQFFQDSGQYWDAWNIDPNYAQHPLPAPQVQRVEWIEAGEVRQRLRVTLRFQSSEFQQDYILDRHADMLRIQTQANWQERHVLVKAAFPLTVSAEVATYEIPFGAIQRPTEPKTPQEKAKWEVPALHWADLSVDTNSDRFGVSLLNDCKYGYDARSNCLRLTLLRGATWPDPEADRGMHRFTYAVYPHGGSWQEAGTVQRGYGLNVPLVARVMEKRGDEGVRGGERMSFLELVSEDVVLAAVKQAEDGEGWILRCYECHGRGTEVALRGALGWMLERRVDVLERPVDCEGALTAIAPWKIVSFVCGKRSPVLSTD